MSSKLDFVESTAHILRFILAM